MTILACPIGSETLKKPAKHLTYLSLKKEFFLHILCPNTNFVSWSGPKRIKKRHGTCRLSTLGGGGRGGFCTNLRAFRMTILRLDLYPLYRWAMANGHSLWSSLICFWGPNLPDIDGLALVCHTLTERSLWIRKSAWKKTVTNKILAVIYPTSHEHFVLVIPNWQKIRPRSRQGTGWKSQLHYQIEAEF